MHARPAVAGFPDEVRDEQRGGDRDREREAPRAQDVATACGEQRDQQNEDDRERVLRLEPDPGRNPEQRPRASPQREPQGKPENDHRRQLVECDRLEEQVRAEHPGREPDHHGRERLRATRRSELACDEGADQHGARAREDRERAQADEGQAEQLPGKRGNQRRHGRELDVAALQVPAGDGVVQLVAVPPVSSRDGKLERALQCDDHHHRHGRKRDGHLLCGPVCHVLSQPRASPSGPDLDHEAKQAPNVGLTGHA